MSTTTVVGVTGTIGTGKSTFSQYLIGEEGEHINADDLAKDLMRPGKSGYDPVVEEFGTHILDKNGYIDPQKMADLVFNDSQKLKKLESILHPLVYDEIEKKISETDKSFYVIEAPLLFESNGDELCDLIITVTAPADKVERRLRSRNINPEEISKRRKRQLPEEEKAERADLVIENSGTISELQEKARELRQKLLDDKSTLKEIKNE